MKFLLALFVASQAILLISGQIQEREQTFGAVGRDSVVRQTFVLEGTAQNSSRIIDIGQPITGIRTFDLTPGGTSHVTLRDGAIGQNRITIDVGPATVGSPHNVRVTAFSSSTLVHASVMLMAIAAFFAHFMR